MIWIIRTAFLLFLEGHPSALATAWDARELRLHGWRPAEAVHQDILERGY